jgi:hypothetical protein
MIPSPYYRRINHRSPAHRQNERRRLVLEALEARELLSTVTTMYSNTAGSVGAPKNAQPAWIQAMPGEDLAPASVGKWFYNA